MNLRQLLERPPFQEYLQEYTALLIKEKLEEEIITEDSAIIFRLSDQWLALPTKNFIEICETRSFHRIPYRKNQVLLGIANIKGELRLCVSLKEPLKIHEEKEGKNWQNKRLIVFQCLEMVWVFPVDEIYGIHHFDVKKIANFPLQTPLSTTNYFRGMIPWEKRDVSYIDEEKLFENLKTHLTHVEYNLN